MRGLIGWFALAVVLVGADTLVQIQRDPEDPGYTQVDGFVRVVLFVAFIIALLVVTKIGFVSVVQALTFGVIKPEKPVAEKAAITFDIPETEEDDHDVPYVELVRALERHREDRPAPGRGH